MTIDKVALEKNRHEQAWRQLLNEWRRQALEKARESIAAQTQWLAKTRQSYHQAEVEYKESTHERNRIHSTESVAAVIASFHDSLQAIGKMKAGLIKIFAGKAYLKVYKTATNPEAAPLLAAGGDLLRQFPHAALKFLDKRLGTDMDGYLQEPLSPAIIPYLAEVDDKGVLTCNLQANEQAHITLDDIQQYEDAFRQAIIRGMRAARNVDNTPMYTIDDTDPNAPIIKHAGTDELLTPEEFAEFREACLTPQLSQEFGEEFRAEGPPAQRGNNTPGFGG